jgi:DNA processing protein
MARRIDPEAWWEPYAARGIRVTWWGAPTYPRALLLDPEPAGVLFWRGSLEWLARPCVALVGTRRPTPGGRRVAFELGRDLAAAGVCVVSGLALGIDGAAHAGAVQTAAVPGGAGPVGVAANGVDVPYPRRHFKLWEEVVSAGAVLAETLPGAPAEAWRFPVRNRIIAGLSQLVVVVESHAAGGSLITAEAALARGIDVRVVPGPVQSPASAGSNQLLYDGPGPVRDARDVLDALGLFLSDPPSRASAGQRGERTDRRPTPEQRAVLEAVGWQPCSTGQVIERSGLPVAQAMVALDGLEQLGRLAREGDWWVQRPVPTISGGRAG